MRGECDVLISKQGRFKPSQFTHTIVTGYIPTEQPLKGEEVRKNKVAASFIMQNLPHHAALTSLGATPLRAKAGKCIQGGVFVGLLMCVCGEYMLRR